MAKLGLRQATQDVAVHDLLASYIIAYLEPKRKMVGDLGVC